MTATQKPKVEVFSAGCPACDEAVTLAKGLSGESFDVEVLDIREPAVLERAKGYGVRFVPAIVIDGQLLCTGQGPDIETIKATGLGPSSLDAR